MKIAWLEIRSGLSGDMFLGAILDAGWSEDRLRSGIEALGLGPYRLEIVRRGHHGLTGLGLHVESVEAEPPHRHFTEIRRMLEAASLPEPVRRRSIDVFRLLAEAEARVHGVVLEEVHFHEVGAVDSLVDVVGTILGLHELGVERVTASAVPLGHGEIHIGHGTVASPAPATAILLEGWPVYPDDVDGEFVTPTAASLLRILAEPGAAIPPMRVDRVGYGAGAREHPRLPNLVRLWVGESEPSGRVEISSARYREVAVLETQIDDMDPRFLAALADELIAHGALDAYRTPVLMKKGRQGTLLSVIAQPIDADRLTALILTRSSTLGVRVRLDGRWETAREVRTIETGLGTFRVKWRGEPGHRLPTVEHDDLTRASQATGLSLLEIEFRILSEICAQE